MVLQEGGERLLVALASSLVLAGLLGDARLLPAAVVAARSGAVAATATMAPRMSSAPSALIGGYFRIGSPSVRGRP